MSTWNPSPAPRPAGYSWTTAVTFYKDGEALGDFWEHEVLPPLAIGDGIVWGDGRRYRVVDRWFSFDKHGQFDLGWHVFLELVEAGDDRLRQLAPDYFTS